MVIGLMTGGISVLCGVVALYGHGLNAQLAFATAILTAILGLITVTLIMNYVQRYEAAERAYLAKRTAIEEKCTKERAKKTKPSTGTGRRTSAIKSRRA